MLQFIRNLFHKETVDFSHLVSAGAVIVDVRSTGEFLSGHITGSKNIPLESIPQKLNELKRLHKPIITVCRSGNRSASAKAILEKAGIEVYNGGSWVNLKHHI